MYDRTELLVLRLISKGCTDMEAIQSDTGLSRNGLYATIRRMRGDDLLFGRKGLDVPRTPYHAKLMRILEATPNAVDLLSDSGFGMLSDLREHRTVDELMVSTGLSRASVYRRLQDAMSVGAVTKGDDGTYHLNDVLWPSLRGLFDSKDDMDMEMDRRVPFGSEILYRDGDRVLYSSPSDHGGARTGLSYFEATGFPGASAVGFYSTQTEQVTEERAFDDEYRIASSISDYRPRLMFMMHYMTVRGRIPIADDVIGTMSLLESGEVIEGWPDWSDAESKARDLGMIR